MACRNIVLLLSVRPSGAQVHDNGPECFVLNPLVVSLGRGAGGVSEVLGGHLLVDAPLGQKRSHRLPEIVRHDMALDTGTFQQRAQARGVSVFSRP